MNVKPKLVVDFYNEEYLRLEYADDEMFVSVRRQMRLIPYTGMKQPCPAGGMLGLEVILEVKDFGKPASDYKWELCLGRRKMNHGKIGHAGSVELPLPLPYEATQKYRLIITRPSAKREPQEGIRKARLKAQSRRKTSNSGSVKKHKEGKGKSRKANRLLQPKWPLSKRTTRT